MRSPPRTFLRSWATRLVLAGGVVCLCASADAKTPTPAKAPPPPPRPTLAAKLPPAPKKVEKKDDKPAPPTDPALEAYRMKMVSNVAQASKSSAALGVLARRNAPANLPADQRKAWDAQTKLLTDYATKVANVKTKMESVLAKPKASVSELASTNFELKQLEESLTEESQKLVPSSKAVGDRHAGIADAFKT